MEEFNEIPQEKEKSGKSIFALVLAIVVILSAFFGMRIFMSSHFSGVVVQGDSMQQTLYDGEQLLMRRTNDKDQLKRGDIIVIQTSKTAGATSKTGFIIKRLIGLEGDKIYCRHGRVFICYAGADEYVELDEPYAYYAQDKGEYFFASYENPFVVGENGIFYLGDNRQDSKDSEEEYQSETGVFYTTADVYGVVKDWALTYQKPLEWIFF